MAAVMATSMVILNPKCFAANPKLIPKPAPAPAVLPPLQPRGLTAAALSGAVFSALSTAASPALAVQQLAEIAEGDNRGIALLLPLVPAVLWVLYNIFQPALNQLERMRSSKGVIVGLGLGLGAAGFLSGAPEALAAGEVAEAAGSDSRGQLLLFVIAPAILWVLYNILQPALNQLERMRSQ